MWIGESAFRAAISKEVDWQGRLQNVHVHTVQPGQVPVAAAAQWPQVPAVVVGTARRQVLAVVDDRETRRGGAATEVWPQDASPTTTVAAWWPAACQAYSVRHRRVVPTTLCGARTRDVRRRATDRLSIIAGQTLRQLRQLAVAVAQCQCCLDTLRLSQISNNGARTANETDSAHSI